MSEAARLAFADLHHEAARLKAMAGDEEDARRLRERGDDLRYRAETIE